MTIIWLAVLVLTVATVVGAIRETRLRRDRDSLHRMYAARGPWCVTCQFTPVTARGVVCDYCRARTP